MFHRCALLPVRLGFDPGGGWRGGGWNRDDGLAYRLGPQSELKKGILGSGISMIAGSLGQMRTKSARDHDRRPKCLNLKLRHNAT
jgi:hypothetical protein